MAQIVLTIPDAVLARVTDAIASTQDYTTAAQTGETKVQFAKRMLGRWIKQQVRNYEASRDADTAKVAAWTNVESTITIT